MKLCKQNLKQTRGVGRGGREGLGGGGIGRGWVVGREVGGG